MYSPNFDAIVSAGGLEVPIPGQQPEITKHTVLKFTSVIRDSKAGLLLLAISALSIIRGKELNLYHSLQFHAAPIVLPLPMLSWHKPFVYASKLREAAAFAAAQRKKRARLQEDEVSRQAARQRRTLTQSSKIHTAAIMPKAFAVLLEAPVSARPRLR